MDDEFDGYTECPVCKSKRLAVSYEDVVGDCDVKYLWTVDCLDCGQTISDGAT